MITISKKEKCIFNLLLSAAPEGTVLRVAGGWIRDKLLDLDSHDIDITINNMSGEQFAMLLQDKLKNHGNITVIAAKPEQSKHLETAQMSVYGQIIDFANLRKETYAQSRIPVIEPGTPLEDARRRDLTVNALFYNLNTGLIEDYVGGLEDLKNRVARTPLDPIQTFLDDPLRILRTIRFCAKYNLIPDPAIIEAARDPDVQSAFQSKISKERIWMEMVRAKEPEGWKCGFLNGPNPLQAIELIEQFGFREILFSPKNMVLESWEMDQKSTYHDFNVWEHTKSTIKYLQEHAEKVGPEETAIRNMALVLHDIGKLDPAIKKLHSNGINYQYKRHEESSANIAEIVLGQLTAPNDFKERVVKLIREHMRLHHTRQKKPPFDYDLSDKPSNASLRRVLRDMGDDWRMLVDISVADINGKLNQPGDLYAESRDRMEQLLIETPKQVRPINGHDLMSIGIAAGPEMGRLLKLLDEQLLEEPNMSREKALEFVEGNRTP